MAWVCRMNLDCPAVRRPDACLLFDLEPETAMRRITARAGGTATEIYETLEQQTRIRARFRRVREMLAEQDRILTIDAAGNREDIARQVYALWQELALG